MVSDKITRLIEEMQEVKQQYATLEIHEILRIFNIAALNELNFNLTRLANG